MGFFDWFCGEEDKPKPLNVLKENNLGRITTYESPYPSLHIFYVDTEKAYRLHSDALTPSMKEPDSHIMRSGLVLGGFLYKLDCSSGEYYEIRED